MIAALKAEYRKVFTIRSTYFLLSLVLLIAIFFAFYVSGWHIDTADLHNPTTLATDVTSAVAVGAIFVALIGLLLVTHEYRYNTIMYSLTSSNSRSKVLLAKFLVITVFSIIFSIVLGVLSPLLSLAGIHLHHLHLAPQTLHYGNLLWRSVFFGWGYAMAGLVIATLVRNQVGAIITLFIVPSTVENLLGLLLKNNVVYLPFSALHEVIGQGGDSSYVITPQRGALIFMGYLIVAWAVAWLLFLRRDAN